MNRRTNRAASAIIALSATLLLVAPVWAAKPAGDSTGSNSGGNGGGNQGSVRVVDAVSGVESLTNNEPQVCTFFLAFDGAPNGESGEWSIVDWPPTGTGAEVADGGYAIPSGGSYVTGTLELAAGHYRVQWQAINSQSEKHKTFWVVCAAEEPEDQPDELEPPADEPTDEPEDDEQPADEPTDEPEDDEQPADEPTDEPVAEGDTAPSSGGGPVVSELPDTAVPEPTSPRSSATFGILLLALASGTLLARPLPFRR